MTRIFISLNKLHDERQHNKIVQPLLISALVSRAAFERQRMLVWHGANKIVMTVKHKCYQQDHLQLMKAPPSLPD